LAAATTAATEAKELPAAQGAKLDELLQRMDKKASSAIVAAPTVLNDAQKNFLKLLVNGVTPWDEQIVTLKDFLKLIGGLNKSKTLRIATKIISTGKNDAALKRAKQSSLATQITEHLKDAQGME
jgi:hypothetical protein